MSEAYYSNIDLLDSIDEQISTCTDEFELERLFEIRDQIKLMLAAEE